MSEHQVSSLNNDGELEQNARVALLQHFSSKSSNQVTNALTIAVVFFAFIAAMDAFKTIMGSWSPLLFGITVVLLLALTIHTANRVFYWGTLTSYVLSSDFVSPDFLKQKIDFNNARTLEIKYENYLKKNKDTVCSWEYFKEFNEKQGIKNGELPANSQDYQSASFNMQRLSEGCYREIDRSTSDNWRKIMLFSGPRDPMVIFIGASMPILAVYLYFNLLINYTVLIVFIVLICAIGSFLVIYWLRLFFKNKAGLKKKFGNIA